MLTARPVCAAAEIWQQARDLAVASGNPGRLAYIDASLGASAFDQGKDALAERSLVEALAVLGPEGDLHMQATTRELLAKLAIRQRTLGDRVEFEMATGTLAEETPFAPHGHLIRLRVKPG